MVITPPGFSRSFMPATKSFTSGTCASTLLPISRSACVPSATSSRAVCRPNSLAIVGTPLTTAASATLRAGSIPRTGTPLTTK